MHEMGIVLNIVRTAEEHAKRNHACKIARLTLNIGDLTGVVSEYVRDCWEAATEDTMLDGAELVIHEIEGIVSCDACGHEYLALDNLKPASPVCPSCGSPKWTVKTGREVEIEDIAVYG
jgi:hydrogenase nickel incorporation protein HypA/HybF